MSLLPLDPYAPGGQMNPDGRYQRHGVGALQDAMNRMGMARGLSPMMAAAQDALVQPGAPQPMTPVAAAPGSILSSALAAQYGPSAPVAGPGMASPPSRASVVPPGTPPSPTAVPLRDASPDLASQIGSMALPDVSATGRRNPGFFSKDGGWRDVVGTIGDLLGAASSPGGGYWAAKGRLRKQEHDDQLLRETIARQQANRMQDRQWQVEDRDAKLNTPQYFMSGRDRVSFDPVSGNSQVIYDGPEDYESYAASLGLDPETDGNAYDSAVQDYVLRGNGPTSQAARRALEQERQNGRMLLRATPTYAQANPRPRSGGGGGGRGRAPSLSGTMAPLLAKVARGEKLTPGEMAAWSMYRPGRTGGGGRSATGGGLPRPANKAEYDRLPRGTEYINPNGQKLRKQ